MFRVEERRASDLHGRLRQASEDVHAGLASAAASCGGTRSGIQLPDSAAAAAASSSLHRFWRVYQIVRRAADQVDRMDPGSRERTAGDGLMGPEHPLLGLAPANARAYGGLA